MSVPRRLAILVAYDGRNLHGFQRQPGMLTVQEELESAWTAITGERATVHGSGRTDAGVHAWGQVAHFNTHSGLPLAQVRDALNAYLPREIAVRQAAEVRPDFHARASATGKLYLYRIAESPVRPVLEAGRAAWERSRLDLEAMRAAAGRLLGRHDFASFAAAGRDTHSSVRTLRAVHLWRARGGLAMMFEADGFLYRMVRNLVGTLLEVGRRRRAPEWVEVVLEARDRRKAGATAPAEGLYLWRVRYDEDPF